MQNIADRLIFAFVHWHVEYIQLYAALFH